MEMLTPDFVGIRMTAYLKQACPNAIGIQEDVITSRHCGLDPQSVSFECHSELDSESIYALDAES